MNNQVVQIIHLTKKKKKTKRKAVLTGQNYMFCNL